MLNDVTEADTVTNHHIFGILCPIAIDYAGDTIQFLIPDGQSVLTSHCQWVPRLNTPPDSTNRLTTLTFSRSYNTKKQVQQQLILYLFPSRPKQSFCFRPAAWRRGHQPTTPRKAVTDSSAFLFSLKKHNRENVEII